MDFQAHFLKKSSTLMKNTVSQEFKGMDQMKMVMTEQQVVPSCSISIGIKALDSQYTMYDPHVHFIMCHLTPRTVKCVELRVESDKEHFWNLALHSHLFNVASIVPNLEKSTF